LCPARAATLLVCLVVSLVFCLASGSLQAQPSFITPTGDIEDRTLDDILATGFIEIAVYRDFPPYSYLEGDEPRGLDIEVGRLLADTLGVEARWFWVTADESVEDDLRNNVWKGSLLDKAVADVMLRVPYDREYSYAIDGYGLPKHDQVVMFGPYHAESWTLARDLAKTGEVRNLAIFRFQKIGVELDSLPDLFLAGVYGGQLVKNLTHYRTTFEALDALAAGELSAVAGMRSQIEWGLGERLARFDVDNDGLEALARRQWDIGAAVKHTHRQLAYEIEAILDAAVRDGRLEAIFSAYGVSWLRPSIYDGAE
jgi:ABC-type amino acid transport substrate-binding protein